MIGEQLVPNTTDALVARAVLRDIRHTPQKARRIVDLIRGQRADDALTILKFAPQSAGADVYTLLNSAVANAKQQNPAIRGAEELWVVEALVDEGRTMKRFRPRAQGRGFRILKRSSHISVAVSDVKTVSKTISRTSTKSQTRNPKRSGDVAGAPVKEAAAVKSVAKKTTAKKTTAKKATAKKTAAAPVEKGASN
jgi:large subunit ribosomal protein L22